MPHNSDLLQVDAGITDGNLGTSVKGFWGGVGWGGVERGAYLLSPRCQNVIAKSNTVLCLIFFFFFFFFFIRRRIIVLFH